MDKDTYSIDEFENIDESDSSKNENIYSGIIYVNQTHGKKKNKMLYKIKPYARTLKELVVPYTVRIEFNKNNPNRFVLFKYDDENSNPPTGSIIETIGYENNLKDYYKYLQYCYGIFNNNSFKKHFQKIKLENIDTVTNIADIITIDGMNTDHYDDAISCDKNSVTVYISNVAYWIEKYNLYEFCENINRVKTIYLPDSRELMFSKEFSDLCSLKAGEKRIAISMTINVHTKETKINLCENIIVKNNYVYDDDCLLNDELYKMIIENTKLIENINFESSRDLIAYWMIFVNREFTKYLNGTGVYKPLYSKQNDEDLIKSLEENKSFNKYYTIESCKYAQFTSPIRRMGDIINIMLICNYNKGMQFAKNWLENIEEKNEKMKKSRYLETTALYLNKFEYENEEEITYTAKYMGSNIFKLIDNDRLIRINTTKELQIGVSYECKIYVINRTLKIQIND